MNPGLVYLLRKGITGRVRFVLRRLRTPKGLLVTMGTVLLLCLLIGPQLMLYFLPGRAGARSGQAESIRAFGPAALLLMGLVAMLTGRALQFKPSEIQFLFPAPVRRRELLQYLVLGRLQGVVLTALWLSVFVGRHAHRWGYGLVGLFLAIAFTLLVGILSGLLFSTAGVRFGQQRGKFVAGLITMILIACYLLSRADLPVSMDVQPVLDRLLESPAARAVLFPTRTFVEVFLAESATSFLLWSAGAAGILFVLFLAIVRLDVAYLEGALEKSRKAQADLERMRSAGAPFGRSAPSKARFALPGLPRLGGVGPLAWRQLTEVVRNWKVLLSTLFFLSLIALPFLFGMRGSRSGDHVDFGAAGPFIFLLFLSLLLTQNFVFDFRRDLDRMAYLKSLPLSSMAVAAGQILPAAAVLTLLELVLFSTFLSLRGEAAAGAYTVCLLILFPINWLSYSLDNLFFLLWPYRLVPGASGGSRLALRPVLAHLLKILCLAAVLVPAGFAAFFITEVVKGQLFLASAVAAMVVAAVCVPLTALVAWAFRAFDITRDVPA